MNPTTRTPKLKVFRSFSRLIRGIPNEHRAANGCAQKDVVVRCASRKRLAEILYTTTAHMRLYGGVHDVTGKPEWEAIAILPERVYYQPERIRSGEIIKDYVLLSES